MSRRHTVLLLALVALAGLAATAEARSPAKVIDEDHCLTEPVPESLVPDEVEEHFAMGSPVHGHGALWSVAFDRSWVDFRVDPPGPAISGLKLGWYRTEPGHVEVTVELLPSSEEHLRPGVTWDPPAGSARVPDGYGLTGFQVSGIEFPAPGCWSVTGELVSPEPPRRVIATMSFLWWVPETVG